MYPGIVWCVPMSLRFVPVRIRCLAIFHVQEMEIAMVMEHATIWMEFARHVRVGGHQLILDVNLVLELVV